MLDRLSISPGPAPLAPLRCALPYCGFASRGPTALTLAELLASCALLSLAGRARFRSAPRFAVWVGIGTLGAISLGAIFHGEPMSARTASFVLVIAGIIDLKIATPR